MQLSTLLGSEVILCSIIIAFVSYTEIDWSTYMQQVDLVLNGELDYYRIAGETGPLVYPAGHVYIFSILKYVTSGNVLYGQIVFALLYVACLYLVFKSYQAAKVPAWVFIACCLSRRLHSIFVLRLFNDCFCVFFCHLSFHFLLKRDWNIACIIYSIAVSVKMNAFLFAPGLLFILSNKLGFTRAIHTIVIYCGLPQLLLGLPFLIANPIAYIHRSFELSRVFQQYWSVNLKFLPEDVFLSKATALFLLALTILTWSIFYWKFWRKLKLGDPANVLYVLYTSQFVGVVFSRTLHYQFYSWYFWTLPGLVHWAKLPGGFGWLLIIIIELAFNSFPSTAVSSLALQFAHVILLVGLLRGKI